MNKTGVSCTPLKVFEAFAGIGAQSKAISLLSNGEKFKIVGTSEWDAGAIISYALIHNHKNFNQLLKKAKKLSEAALDKYLGSFTFSLNSKAPGRIVNKQRGFKEVLYAANKANNNFPNIKEVGAKQIRGVDVLTYSFPCQGLSIANMGRGKGIAKEADSTSNLIWEVKRILEEAKEANNALPSFLIMENVKELIGKKHKPDFDGWIDELEKLGYLTSYAVIKALDHESIQRRERVFAVSWLKEMGFSRAKHEDVLEHMVEKHVKRLSEEERKEIYSAIFKTGFSYAAEIEESTPRDTPSRWRMANQNKELGSDEEQTRVKNKWMLPTLTTKQDRHPNMGMLKLKGNPSSGKLPHRFITPREAFMIMGFSSEDFDRVRWAQEKKFVNADKLYRQAGNSIVVTVIRDVFKVIWEMKEKCAKLNFEEWERGTGHMSKKSTSTTKVLTHSQEYASTEKE